ncbi:MAG: cob(I)yrinic acid a,c-diamide adenosyltransferase [Desulfurococcales archaeon]|nr:cob(I)yrinic acid a,c-diamide adenosyltransferase [Desulfurococcales archaeon]
MTRLYTRTGDKGETFCLAAGGRVPKSSVLIELVGALDEAATALGAAWAFCEEVCDEEIRDFLEEAQRIIFNVGFSLSGKKTLKGDEVRRLEALSDKFMEGIELKGFVLPGSTKESSMIHLARVAVRRAERRFFSALDSGALEKDDNTAYLGQVLNRLSDTLFAAALKVEAERGKIRYVR